jgi:hypothetical protein
MQDALTDKVSKIRSRYVGLALLGVIAVVGSPAVAQIQCSDLSVSNLRRDDTSVPRRITGTATNTSDHEMKSVGLSFTLYDSNGTVVGFAVASQMNLAAGRHWRFQAAVLTEQPFSRVALGSSDCSG